MKIGYNIPLNMVSMTEVQNNIVSSRSSNLNSPDKALKASGIKSEAVAGFNSKAVNGFFGGVFGKKNTRKTALEMLAENMGVKGGVKNLNDANGFCTVLVDTAKVNVDDEQKLLENYARCLSNGQAPWAKADIKSVTTEKEYDDYILSFSKGNFTGAVSLVSAAFYVLQYTPHEKEWKELRSILDNYIEGKENERTAFSRLTKIDWLVSGVRETAAFLNGAGGKKGPEFFHQLSKTIYKEDNSLQFFLNHCGDKAKWEPLVNNLVNAGFCSAFTDSFKKSFKKHGVSRLSGIDVFHINSLVNSFVNVVKEEFSSKSGSEAVRAITESGEHKSLLDWIDEYDRASKSVVGGLRDDFNEECRKSWKTSELGKYNYSIDPKQQIVASLTNPIDATHVFSKLDFILDDLKNVKDIGKHIFNIPVFALLPEFYSSFTSAIGAVHSFNADIVNFSYGVLSNRTFSAADAIMMMLPRPFLISKNQADGFNAAIGQVISILK